MGLVDDVAARFDLDPEKAASPRLERSGKRSTRPAAPSPPWIARSAETPT